eukprot:9278955-Pyramimonas_sp.AAC.1
MQRSAQSQTGSHSDSCILRPTRAQTRSRSDLLTRIPTQTQAQIAPRLTHTQNQSLSDLLCVALALADCGSVSSERFALAHRRPLTNIKRKTYQYNEMRIWGAPRRVIILSFSSPPPHAQTYSCTD